MFKKQGSKKSSGEKVINKDMTSFKEELEQKTGFHFDLKGKKDGSGQIIIRFESDENFNAIYDYLLKR